MKRSAACGDNIDTESNVAGCKVCAHRRCHAADRQDQAHNDFPQGLATCCIHWTYPVEFVEVTRVEVARVGRQNSTALRQQSIQGSIESPEQKCSAGGRTDHEDDANANAIFGDYFVGSEFWPQLVPAGKHKCVFDNTPMPPCTSDVFLEVVGRERRSRPVARDALGSVLSRGIYRRCLPRLVTCSMRLFGFIIRK